MRDRSYRIWNDHYIHTDWHTHDDSYWELPISFDSTSYNTFYSAAETLNEWINQCCISANDLNAALERASQEIGPSISENQKAMSFSPNGLEALL